MPARNDDYPDGSPAPTQNHCSLLIPHYSFVYQSARKADSPAPSPLDCFANARNDDSPDVSPARSHGPLATGLLR
jgi:hypothetical protein